MIPSSKTHAKVKINVMFCIGGVFIATGNMNFRAGIGGKLDA